MHLTCSNIQAFFLAVVGGGPRPSLPSPFSSKRCRDLGPLPLYMRDTRYNIACATRHVLGKWNRQGRAGKTEKGKKPSPRLVASDADGKRDNHDGDGHRSKWWTIPVSTFQHPAASGQPMQPRLHLGRCRLHSRSPILELPVCAILCTPMRASRACARGMLPFL
jgi:hypothetical protein